MQNRTNTPKKIIYLDQGAISNITKVLDPDFPRREQLLEKQQVWLELYKKLDRLRRLQLIVCPQSYFHLIESMISPEISFESLQYVYSYLSNGCNFDDPTAILDTQIQGHFIDYLSGHPERDRVIPVSMVTSGHLPDEWQDRFRAVVFDQLDPNTVANTKALREKQYKNIERAFALWRQEREACLLAVNEQVHSLGREMIEAYFSYFTKWLAYSLGLEQPNSPLDLFPPPSTILFTALFQILEGHGTSDIMEQLSKIHEYFQSLHIRRVPFINLSSMLFAAIARRAPDMKSPPNIGTTTDVMMIAALLPYCHAMFVDNPMRGHLIDQPLSDEVARFGTRIFSFNSMADFLANLDEIEAGASEQHLACVTMTYGEERLEPFVDLIVQWRRREREK